MSVAVAMDGVQAAGCVAEARTCLAADRRAALLALNGLFRTGRVPVRPLDGRYRGDLITTTCGPALDRLMAALDRVYMPWRGKVFDAALDAGGNLFAASGAVLIRPVDPNVRDDGPGLVWAFPFRTHTGAGVIDSDRMVLKIDYDVPANPWGLIRRVLDELVEVAPSYYLGKAHLHVRGHWRTVAYFALGPQTPVTTETRRDGDGAEEERP